MNFLTLFNCFSARKVLQFKTEQDKQFRKITFIHGTNSALLPALSRLDYKLLPTGNLLDRGIVPMGGELSLDGMLSNGVNQHSISGGSLHHIDKCWNTYAKDRSNSFHSEQLTPEKFSETLGNLRKSSPISDEWDSLIITLTRYKQWDKDLFIQLCETHKTEIEALITRSKQTVSPEEQLLKALDYDVEKLKKAMVDPALRDEILDEFGYNHQLDHYFSSYWSEKPDTFLGNSTAPGCLNYDLPTLKTGKYDGMLLEIINFKLSQKIDQPQKLMGYQRTIQNEENDGWIPYDFIKERLLQRIQESPNTFQNRLKRLSFLFDLTYQPMQFKTQEEKNCLTNPFPILFGSTKLSPTCEREELVIPSGKLGDEIDIMVVESKDYAFTAAWLKKNNLAHRISLYSSEVLS